MRDLATLLESPDPEATLAEWLFEANSMGYDKSYREGYDGGYRDGYDDAYAEGRKEGYVEAYEMLSDGQ